MEICRAGLGQLQIPVLCEKQIAAHGSGKRGIMDQLKGMRQFITEEEGMGTVEIILIIVVLVSLVILFKSQITKVANTIFQKITTQSNKV